MNFNIEKIDNFTGHRDCIYSLAEGTSSNTFFSSGGDGTVVEWNTDSPDLGKPFVKIHNSSYAMHHDTHIGRLYLANNFEGIHEIDTRTKKEVRSLNLGKVSFFSIKSHEGDLFVGDLSGIIQVIDKESLKLKKQIKGSEKSARSIAINTKSNELAVAFSDHKIRIFDLSTFQLKFELQGHANSVFALQYTKDGEELISGSRDAHLIAWSVNHHYEMIQNVPAHIYAINDIILLKEEKLIITASMDKSIKVWDEKNLKLLKVIDKARHAGHGTSINKLLWLPEKKRLLSASDDRSISMWKLF